MKTILITGTSSGIGRSCALELDRLGFSVLAGVRTKEDAHQLKKILSKNSHPILLDITDTESIQEAKRGVEKLTKDHGLFALVNNAGIGDIYPFEAMPIDRLRQIFDVNFFGTAEVTKAFIPLIRKAKGRIVNISSIGGLTTIPFGLPICASKYAMESLTEALRLELAPWGICVISINPSFITTKASLSMMNKVNENLTLFSDESNDLYKDVFLRMAKTMSQEEAKESRPPLIVAEVVAKALLAEHPKSHYPVGSKAKLIYHLSKWLPESLMDKLKMSHLSR